MMSFLNPFQLRVKVLRNPLYDKGYRAQVYRGFLGIPFKIWSVEGEYYSFTPCLIRGAGKGSWFKYDFEAKNAATEAIFLTFDNVNSVDEIVFDKRVVPI